MKRQQNQSLREVVAVAKAYVSGVVLAAGLSQRMGSINKLGLEINGKPLLRHCVEVYLQSKLRSLYIVVGHEAELIRGMLKGVAVTFIDNPHFLEGQMSSVHTGLTAVEPDAQAVMICLSDQALLNVQDINHLIDSYDKSTQDRILIPTYRGQRGNPIIIPQSHVQGIKQGNRNLGCKRFIKNNPQLTLTCAMPNTHVIVDIDTPEDYKNVIERTVNGA